MTGRANDGHGEEESEDQWPGEWQSASAAGRDTEEGSDDRWPAGWKSASDVVTEPAEEVTQNESASSADSIAEQVEEDSPAESGAQTEPVTDPTEPVEPIEESSGETPRRRSGVSGHSTVDGGSPVVDTDEGGSHVLRRISLTLALLFVFVVVLSATGIGTVPSLPRPSTVPGGFGLEIILLVVLTAIVTLVGTTYVSRSAEGAASSATEFYVVGGGENRSNVPRRLAVGENARVVVGVVNNEGREMTYTMVTRANDRTLHTRTLTLANGETTERSLAYSLEQPGTFEIRILLYLRRDPDLDASPYRSVRFGTVVSATE